MVRPVRVGEVLHDKYIIKGLLGEGGMAVVYTAWHARLDQRVAIKMLQPALSNRPDVVERFLREARAASRIQSEHVVRLLDVDKLPSGAPYVVMEFLEGSDLSEVLRRKNEIPLQEAVAYILDACAALGEAHTLGVVHRDIKPANLFLTKKRNGRAAVKVLDFGISKIISEGLDLTKAGVILGSLRYMSPEQLRSSRDVDHRTDIWSLGVVLYRLCTGVMPFDGASDATIISAILDDGVRSPSSIRPDLPRGIDSIILRCLEKNRDARFSDIASLVRALEPFATTTTSTSGMPAPITGGSTVQMAEPSPELSEALQNALASVAKQNRMEAPTILEAAIPLPPKPTVTAANPLPATRTYIPPPPPVARRKPKSASIVIVVVAVLLLLIVGTIIAVRP